MNNRILLKCDTIRIPAVMNNTAAARDFKRRLPVTVSGRRSADSYSFPVAVGCFDPEETQTDWKAGDISISGGRLRVFFDGGEASVNFAGATVIAHIRKRDLHLIHKFPDNVRLTIEAAE